MSNPGWGAVLVGEAANLGDWTFIEGVRTVVEVHTGHTILRSASLDELTSASEVRDRATALIERLNGALALSQRTKPLRFGSVVQLDPNGGLNRFLSPDTGTYEVGGRDADLILTFTDLDGKPQPSQAQDWAAIADGDELLDDALIYFGRLGVSFPAWFNVASVRSFIWSSIQAASRPSRILSRKCLLARACARCRTASRAAAPFTLHKARASASRVSTCFADKPIRHHFRTSPPELSATSG